MKSIERKTIGFVKSHKNNERRRALLPEDVKNIENREMVYVETGYGDIVFRSDGDYRAAGVNVVPRERALACDIIVDVKLGDADFMHEIAPGKLLAGWAHVVQKTAFTDAAIAGGHTVLAWEELFDHGRYLFYRNRELAGEMAIMQAFIYYGKMPYDCTVAVVGNGQTARGAIRVLNGLGARVDVYPRKLEALFRSKMREYDVLVNCVMWDTDRTDRLIYRADLAALKPGCMIVDVSCDPNLEIETTRPTTIDDPVYTVDGVLHYCVDNTPAMVFRSVSEMLSRLFSPLVDSLVTGKPRPMLQRAEVIRDGVVLDEKALSFRERDQKK